VTNDSSNTREKIVAKVASRGFHAVTEDMIVSAGYTTGRYLLSLGFSDRARQVFVVGEEGLVKELRQQGINAFGSEVFDEKAELHKLDIPHAYGAVVAGVDTTLTYRKLAIATRIVIENDAVLIGTNCDSADPFGNGIFLPDAMPTIMALEGATGRKATILGKPTAQMFEPLRDIAGIRPENTIMIGDRLNTDVKFAKTIGAKSALVLTGATGREDARSDPELIPDFVCESVADISELVFSLNRPADTSRPIFAPEGHAIEGRIA
jgi:phosphoglycolate/pyridoxal phosphate phosphatase family enzyme